MKLKNDFELAGSRAYLGELSEYERASPLSLHGT